jgi:hypothetical protein
VFGLRWGGSAETAGFRKSPDDAPSAPGFGLCATAAREPRQGLTAATVTDTVVCRGSPETWSLTQGENSNSKIQIPNKSQNLKSKAGSVHSNDRGKDSLLEFARIEICFESGFFDLEFTLCRRISHHRDQENWKYPMAYQVIARQYRPQQFDDVIGQSVITTTLKNAIEQHRIGHAYLFSGVRGVGKPPRPASWPRR